VPCDSICRLVCLQLSSLLRFVISFTWSWTISSAQVKSSAALITSFSSITG
jgi:hypothetical protein